MHSDKMHNINIAPDYNGFPKAQLAECLLNQKVIKNVP